MLGSVVFWAIVALLLVPVAVPSTRGTPSPAALPFEVHPATALRANATAIAASGTWNCGQGQETIDFFGQGMAGTPPYAYRWEFGDGTPPSVAQNPVHTYHDVFQIQANLTVTDTSNQTAAATASTTLVVPQICTGPVTTDWVGIALYAALVLGIGAGVALLVRRRRAAPPIP